MEFKHIDLLLEKYWAGESSLEEEKTLREYFLQSSIAERHLPFASLFQFFEEEKDLELSEDFDQKLLQELKSSEVIVKVIPPKEKPIRQRYFMLRIAAAIALLLSLWFFFPKSADPVLAEVDQQEMEEAKRTYQEAKAALLFLSKKMNKGTQTAIKGINELDEATKVLRKE